MNTILVSVPINPQILLINVTLTVLLGLEQKSMRIHKSFLSMTILMHSKGKNCHLTLNTFMSIAEHVRHLKVVSGLYSLEVKPSFLRKKSDILSWKMKCAFQLFWAVKVLQN